MTDSRNGSSADSARMAQLAEEIEDSYSGNFVEDILLHESDRRLIVTALNGFAGVAQAVPEPIALRDACERLIAALEGLRPLPLVLDAMAKGLIADARAALASQPSPAATVEMIETGPVTVNEWEGASRPQCSAGSEAADKLDAIFDRIEVSCNWRLSSEERQHIAEAANVLRAVPQSSGMWQPIETAPQDGSYVLLFNALGNYAVSRWGMRYLGDPGPEAWVCDGKYIPNPTHWCPLTRPLSRTGEA